MWTSTRYWSRQALKKIWTEISNTKVSFLFRHLCARFYDKNFRYDLSYKITGHRRCWLPVEHDNYGRRFFVQNSSRESWPGRQRSRCNSLLLSCSGWRRLSRLVQTMEIICDDIINATPTKTFLSSLAVFCYVYKTDQWIGLVPYLPSLDSSSCTVHLPYLVRVVVYKNITLFYLLLYVHTTNAIILFYFQYLVSFILLLELRCRANNRSNLYVYILWSKTNDNTVYFLLTVLTLGLDMFSFSIRYNVPPASFTSTKSAVYSHHHPHNICTNDIFCYLVYVRCGTVRIMCYFMLRTYYIIIIMYFQKYPGTLYWRLKAPSLLLFMLRFMS